MMDCFQATLNSTKSADTSSPPFLLRELDGLQGRADLVVAYVDTCAIPDGLSMEALASCLSTPANARILSLLKYSAPRTMGYLERVSGLSRRSLTRQVRQMSAVGIVDISANSSVFLAYRLPWNMIDIVTYEGKLSNGRRALHQAMGYRSFSRSVQIVMPEPGARRAKRLATIFQNNGIGLISLQEDGSIRTEIRARRHRRPASRRLYLLAVGAILRRLLDQDHHSDSGINSEPP